MEQKSKNAKENKLFEFYSICKLIDFSNQYPDSCSEIKWIIVTNASEAELKLNYKEILDRLSPYQIVGTYYCWAVEQYERNDERYIKFLKRHGVQYSRYVEEVERSNPEFWEDDVLDIYLNHEYKEVILRTISEIKPIQGIRVYKHLIKGMTIREIAKSEGININTVARSIRIGKETLKNRLLAYESSSDKE